MKLYINDNHVYFVYEIFKQIKEILEKRKCVEFYTVSLTSDIRFVFVWVPGSYGPNIYGPLHLWPIFGRYGPYMKYIAIIIIPWRWY